MKTLKQATTITIELSKKPFAYCWWCRRKSKEGEEGCLPHMRMEVVMTGGCTYYLNPSIKFDKDGYMTFTNRKESSRG